MPDSPDRSTTAGEAPGAEFYRSIARQIRDGSCVLFLGPAALAARQSDGAYKPIVEICANHMAQGLNLAATEADSLPFVSSTLRLSKKIADTLIISSVQDFYTKQEREAQLHPVLERLADLPFRIIINTTPDDFFARYYAQAVRDHRFDFYNFRKPAPDPLYEFSDDSPPLIYNLFGWYKKPESLVITYSDQLGYVNKITGAQHERLPDSLLAAFNVPRFYLFLGFDFEDWSLKVLLDALFKNARNSIQPFSYPLKGEPAPGPHARVFFQGEFKMEFPDADLETFVTQLVQHYEHLDSDTADATTSAKAEVLLLYNEAADQAAAKALLNHLHALKVKIYTLADATGQGDVATWLRTTAERCQIILPLLSADFFSEGNPCLEVVDELAAKNNPRNRFLVMPIVLNPVNFDGTPLGNLRTTRPLNKESVYGGGKENQHFADIADTLKKYIDTLP